MTSSTSSSRAAPRSPIKSGSNLFPCLRVLADVLDRVRHSADLLGVFVGNLDIEGFFESHDQFHRIERVGSQVVHERGARSDLALVHTQLFYDDLLHFFVNGCHCFSSFPSLGLRARRRFTESLPRIAKNHRIGSNSLV